MKALDDPALPPTAGAAASLVSRIRLPHLLLLGLALRLGALAVATPTHPDEVFQYLETAHRLLFGHGVVTWEWRLGIRGWLLPVLVSGPMALGAWLDPHGGLHLLAPRFVMVGASLVMVVLGWRMGERISLAHAQVTAFVAATWYEFVYFAPHVMSETVGVVLILPAAFLLSDKARWSGRRLVLAAALLSLAASIRFQYLPAILALVAVSCLLDLRRCVLPLLLGGVIGLLPSVISDLALGATPFAWVIENVRLNLVEHRAEAFSSSGPLGYFGEAWPRLVVWMVPILALAAIGARRYPAIAAMAVVNLVFHSLIAHKEYRFILLSVFAAILLAAIGGVDLMRRLERPTDAAAAQTGLRALCIAWVLASLSCGFGTFRDQWMKYRPEMQLYAAERTDPLLCGLAVYRHNWSITGGYAYLHRATPILYFDDEDQGRPSANLASAVPAFNTVMTTPNHAAELPAQFAAAGCYGHGASQVCAYRRPGSCAPTAAEFEMGAVLKRLGE